jgi:hypothetical protein
LYALDHAIAFGMIKDGAKDGSPDDWRAIQAKIMATTGERWPWRDSKDNSRVQGGRRPVRDRETLRSLLTYS